MIEAHEMVEALEPSQEPSIPDDAQIKVLMIGSIEVCSIEFIEYEPATNTVWLKVEVED